MRKALILFSLTLLTLACSKNEDTGLTDDLVSGDVVYTQVEVDGEVMEYIEEEMVEFGDKDDSILLPIAKTHEVGGSSVLETLNTSSIYRTYTLSQLKQFMAMFAAAYDLEFDPDAVTADGVKNKIAAYKKLKAKADATGIDLGLVISVILKERISKEELKELIENALAEGTTAAEINQGLRTLEQGVEPFFGGARASIEADFCLVYNNKKYIGEDAEVPAYLDKKDTAQPITFSYIDAGDMDISHYNGNSKDYKSKSYTFTYGSDDKPMIKSTIVVEMRTAKHSSYGDNVYIPMVKVSFNDTHVGSSMHIDFTTTMSQAFLPANDRTKVYGSGTVLAHYYDGIKACNRTAQLDFIVNSASGYSQKFWDDKIDK